MYNVSLIIVCLYITLCVLRICMCILHIVFCTVCKYVLSICKLLLLFFCTVWSTVNAPVHFFFFFLHCLSICKLFVVVFFHCLSICKLLVVVVFFLHCLEHAHKNFTHQGTCAVVM